MKVVFSEHASHKYLSRQTTDPELVRRINALILEIQCRPFEGIGKPERLRHARASRSAHTQRPPPFPRERHPAARTMTGRATRKPCYAD